MRTGLLVGIIAGYPAYQNNRDHSLQASPSMSIRSRALILALCLRFISSGDPLQHCGRQGPQQPAHHFRATRRRIAHPQDTPSLALVVGVHRRDKPLKILVAQLLPNNGSLPNNEATLPNVTY